MPESLVICNTSPLLYLHQVSCLELLRKLYVRIVVPPAVIHNWAEAGLVKPSVIKPVIATLHARLVLAKRESSRATTSSFLD